MSEQPINATICPGCGCIKPRNRHLCVDCRETHGEIASSWPEWLRMLVNDSERRRAEELRITAHEVSLADFEPRDEMHSKTDEALWTRPRGEMVVVPVPVMALPYAPCDDDDMNAAYRRANGIAERK